MGRRKKMKSKTYQEEATESAVNSAESFQSCNTNFIIPTPNQDRLRFDQMHASKPPTSLLPVPPVITSEYLELVVRNIGVIKLKSLIKKTLKQLWSNFPRFPISQLASKVFPEFREKNFRDWFKAYPLDEIHEMRKRIFIGVYPEMGVDINYPKVPITFIQNPPDNCADCKMINLETWKQSVPKMVTPYTDHLPAGFLRRLKEIGLTIGTSADKPTLSEKETYVINSFSSFPESKKFTKPESNATKSNKTVKFSGTVQYHEAVPKPSKPVKREKKPVPPPDTEIPERRAGRIRCGNHLIVRPPHLRTNRDTWKPKPFLRLCTCDH